MKTHDFGLVARQRMDDVQAQKVQYHYMVVIAESYQNILFFVVKAYLSYFWHKFFRN